MKLVLHLEAETIIELRRMALKALDLGRIPEEDAPTTLPGDTVSALGDPVKIRKSRKAAPPLTVPEPGDDRIPDSVMDMVNEPEPEANGADGTPLTPTGLSEMLANEALKKETIAKLGALFAAGKVKVVRNALDKYGKGAKSFPEIDAAQFPAIAAALDRGDIA